ncbi:MAG: glycosyltransferase [Rhizobiaceae bacterium]|nr:glycosyltransferase [Rhizobiaceae bacterium]
MKRENIGVGITHPVVTVPARNEEKRLPALLAGLAAQTWIAERARRLDVVIVLNNCTDGSRDAVLESVGEYPGLAVRLIDVMFAEPHAHVGSARRLAMETAFKACPLPENSAILTTDADAVPNCNWVSANLRHLCEGIDLVGGLIVGSIAEEGRLGPDFKRRAELHKRYGQSIDRLASLIDPQPHDSWPRHHDHTGASIAVRADVYQAVGGLPALPFREDVAFVDRVRCGGFLVRHPLDVVVEVSARLAGRAPGGMADCLKTWMRAAATGEALLVEDPARVLERLHRRRRLRDLGAASAGARLATSLVPDVLDAPQTMAVEMAIEIVAEMIEQAEGDVRAA